MAPTTTQFSFSCHMFLFFKNFILVFCIIFWFNNFSQDNYYEPKEHTDTVIFNDGIYLKYENLLKNSPITFNDTIETKGEILKYRNDNGDTIKINLKDTWGKVEKGKIFIYWSFNWTNEVKRVPGSYHRILNIAPIMPLYIYSFTKVESTHGSNNPGMGFYSMPGGNGMTLTQTKKCYVSFNNGNVYSFNKRNILQYIKKDTELFEEFKKSRLKKKDKLLIFTKKYNDRNPVKLDFKKDNPK